MDHSECYVLIGYLMRKRNELAGALGICCGVIVGQLVIIALLAIRCFVH